MMAELSFPYSTREYGEEYLQSIAVLLLLHR